MKNEKKQVESERPEKELEQADGGVLNSGGEGNSHGLVVIAAQPAIVDSEESAAPRLDKR